LQLLYAPYCLATYLPFFVDADVSGFPSGIQCFQIPLAIFHLKAFERDAIRVGQLRCDKIPGFASIDGSSDHAVSAFETQGAGGILHAYPVNNQNKGIRAYWPWSIYPFLSIPGWNKSTASTQAPAAMEPTTGNFLPVGPATVARSAAVIVGA
ncbi:hypothetical protein P4110_31935, partial [Pseudomonas aeruginosa]|nr:hypothetical protein [Pseudomonas aeruginosa]